MPELGRIALVVCLGLSAYAVVVGAYAAATGRRRLALSARNALVACLGAALVASAVLFAALVRSDFSFVYVADHTSLELPTPYKLSAFWGGQEGSLLLWLRDPDRATRAPPCCSPGERRRRSSRGPFPCSALVIGFFSLVLVAVASPVRDPGRAARRDRAQPEPAEPVHGLAPAGALPRLRRPRRAVRVRDGRAPVAPHGRALDRPDPPLDADWRGRSSASASCSARTGPTSRSAGAATSPGTRSRTRR